MYKFTSEFRPTWGRRKPVTPGVGEEKDLRAEGARVVVFFVGGVTIPEVRSVVEVGRVEGREVFVGEFFGGFCCFWVVLGEVVCLHFWGACLVAWCVCDALRGM